MKSVIVTSEIRGALALTDVVLTYPNFFYSPIECVFVLPLENNTILDKFETVIDDIVTTAKVVGKDQAF